MPQKEATMENAVVYEAEIAVELFLTDDPVQPFSYDV